MMAKLWIKKALIHVFMSLVFVLIQISSCQQTHTLNAAVYSILIKFFFYSPCSGDLQKL